MKTVKYIIAFVLTSILFLGQTSCIGVYRKDNGKHKGWFKNPNNPHHPNSTNPGKAKGKGKK